MSSVTNWTLDTDCSVSGLFPFSLTPPSWPPFLRSLFQTEKGKCTLYFSLHFLFLSLTSSRIFFLWIITEILEHRMLCYQIPWFLHWYAMQNMHTEEVNNNFACLILMKIMEKRPNISWSWNKIKIGQNLVFVPLCSNATKQTQNKQHKVVFMHQSKRDESFVLLLKLMIPIRYPT